jgi:hypothetical protein
VEGEARGTRVGRDRGFGWVGAVSRLTEVMGDGYIGVWFLRCEVSGLFDSVHAVVTFV